MNLWKLFGIEPQARKDDFGSLFAALETLLAGLSEQEVIRITGFAGLLGKVAYSDRDISEPELGAIREILTNETPVSPDLFDRILEVVRHHTVELAGLEDHRYTRMLNEVLSRDERRSVVKSLLAVAAVSGSISFEEDQTISLIAKGLRLEHSEYIELRRTFADLLEVFNTPFS
ncbi:MAG: TerB family tellurite resistance protein [Bdellovibrionales bacterium]|nr:TerB family tellurite resistance protein [Bdellovibrionales bacterium]